MTANQLSQLQALVQALELVVSLLPCSNVQTLRWQSLHPTLLVMKVKVEFEVEEKLLHEEKKLQFTCHVNTTGFLLQVISDPHPIFLRLLLTGRTLVFVS